MVLFFMLSGAFRAAGDPQTPLRLGIAMTVLTVIFNNRRWGAVHRSTLSLYPKGHAAQEHEPPFSTLTPRA